MTLMTVMLTAAFVMVAAEFRTTNGSFASTRALNYAQAGLQTYFANSHNLSTGYDSTNYAFSGGYARVVARRLRDSTSTSKQLWIVYATGVDTSTTTNVQGTGGSRVVSQLATLDPGVLYTRAALVSATNVTMTASGTNPISGVNLGFTMSGCTIPPNPWDDTTGLAVPTGAYGGSGSGDPQNGIEYLASASAVIDSTRIDWSKLVNGEFTPDYVNTLPATCSGSSCAYRTYYHTGDVTIPSGQRRGFLIARGDVTLANNAHWDGIIIAGGRLNAIVSSYTVHGITITGLNLSLGENVLTNQIRRGSGRNIKWDYCYARASINSLGYLTPVRSSYTDAWDLY